MEAKGILRPLILLRSKSSKEAKGKERGTVHVNVKVAKTAGEKAQKNLKTVFPIFSIEQIFPMW